jgi:hypothetical protein
MNFLDLIDFKLYIESKSLNLKNESSIEDNGEYDKQ